MIYTKNIQDIVMSLGHRFAEFRILSPREVLIDLERTNES